MHKVRFGEMRCSLARSLDVIGDWWTLLILRDVYLGVCRFDEIVEDLGISRNLLTTRLGNLVDAGILQKHRYSEKPARFEYRLGAAGDDLVPILLALTAWGDRWMQPAEGQPIRFLHRDCNCVLEPAIRCAACGGSVNASNVEAGPGPGGASAPGTKVLARKLMRRATQPL